VEGQRLLLDPSASDARFRIVEWSTERDRFGRMVGTFTYEQGTVRRTVQLGTVSLIP
jgi:hypothetical protein